MHSSAVVVLCCSSYSPYSQPMLRLPLCKLRVAEESKTDSHQFRSFGSSPGFISVPFAPALSRRGGSSPSLRSNANICRMQKTHVDDSESLLRRSLAAQQVSAANRGARAQLDAFNFPTFTPYISQNGHLQTILANFYPPPPEVAYTRVTLPSDDGLDLLKVDIANGTTLEPEVRNQPVAFLLHGLESCSKGTVTLRLADALTQQGFKVVAMNYRSCAEDSPPPRSLRLYHAGFTEDVTTILRALRDAAEAGGNEAPNVFLCGFSLGSNIMCNFLREAGADAFLKYRVAGAFGACTPFNPARCQVAIDSGVRGYIYSQPLVWTMVLKFEEAIAAGASAGNVNPEAVRRARRIGEIDESLIAPIFGFEDKYDYYRSIDARKCLKHIAVPTILMNSVNDPFFGHQDGTSFPTKEDIGDAPVRVIITESGGHCGFLDYDGFHRKRPMFYQRVCAMFCSYMQKTMPRA